MPLITASILSKKLAAGLQGLVMDVKCGNGAFAVSFAMARELADSLVEVANGAGLSTTALITDMNQVLGRSAGNAVEVMETLDYLTGEARDPRLHEVVLALAAEMLLLGGLAEDLDSARRTALAALESGKAAEAFARMVAALGGPADLLERPEAYLPSAPVVVECRLERSGTIAALDTRRVGLTVVGLGGGRRHPADRVDHAVGLTEIRGLGETVGPDRPFARVWARDATAAKRAVAELRAAITLSTDLTELAAATFRSGVPGPVILERIAE